MVVDRKLLLIDFTPIDGVAATSTLKQAYFGGWREDHLLQISAAGSHMLVASTPGGASYLIDGGQNIAETIVRLFQPDILLYRPVADCPALHNFAKLVIAASDAPLVTWIMDDWPANLMLDDPVASASADRDLATLFRASDLNFAISESMAAAFEDRYGAAFQIARNGIDRACWHDSELPRHDETFLIRYAGSVAPEMTLDSVMDVAQTVSALRDEGYDIRLEIRTQTHWRDAYGGLFNVLPGVELKRSNMSAQAYRAWLCAADLVLLAYNFDDRTRRYARYSFANKLPEALASGRAVLGYGPSDLETLNYLKQHELGRLVEAKSALRPALIDLISHEEPRARIGLAGRAHAFDMFDLDRAKRRFFTALEGLLAARCRASTGLGAGTTIATVGLRRSNTAYSAATGWVVDHVPLAYTLFRPVVRWLKKLGVFR